MDPTQHINSRLIDRHNNCIAQGALTNSKHPRSYVAGVYPTHLVRGKGAYVYDGKGREYIDFINGLGTNLLGYGDKKVEEAIAKAIRDGINLSLPTGYEVEAAEKILVLLPSYDRVKFLKTGSEACLAGIRIARQTTGRNKILTSGYHGWGDAFIGIEPYSKGVDYCDVYKFESLTQIDESTAGVIIEPAQLTFYNGNYINEIVDQCKKFGAFLIFDEVITALRVPSLSYTRHFNLNPDLVIMGKALAGGLPLSCVVGKSSYMDDPRYFVSGTFYGEMLSLAACESIVDRMLKKEPDIMDLWEYGEHFRNQFNQLFGGVVQLEGYNTRFSLMGLPTQKALFMQEACKAGLLFGASPFLSFAHLEIKIQIESALKDIATKIKLGLCSIEGQLPMNSFASIVRSRKENL